MSYDGPYNVYLGTPEPKRVTAANPVSYTNSNPNVLAERTIAAFPCDSAGGATYYQIPGGNTMEFYSNSNKSSSG